MKPVKVSGVIPPEHHQQLLALAKARSTTIGVLVAISIRKLLDLPAATLRGLPLDGRTKHAKAEKLKLRTPSGRRNAVRREILDSLGQ